MIVVTFYTPLYADHVTDWLDAAFRVGNLFAYATPVDDLGSWRENVGRKPSFLIQQLHKFERPILFIDVDGRFREPWDLTLDDYDFAAYQINENRMPAADMPFGMHHGIASGTMWFAPTPATFEFLKRWKHAEKGQHRYGQIVLGEIWHRKRPEGLRTFWLPQRYCKVFDARWHEADQGPTVIEHLQASRNKRRKADRGT